MTRRTNARLAGFTFLFYIAVGIASMVVGGRIGGGPSIAGRLAAVAHHTTEARVLIVLALLQGFCAVVLGLALYALTRDEDHDLAMLSLSFRIGEGILGAFPLTTLGLLWLATTQGGAEAMDAGAVAVLGTFLQRLAGWKTTVGATFFAAGSTLFAWLLLRGRMIPAPLAWLGVIASLLLLVVLPAQLAGLLRGSVTQLVWIPMAAFEIPLAVWLLVKGVNTWQ